MNYLLIRLSEDVNLIVVQYFQSTPIGCSLKEAESYTVELLSDCRGFGFSVRMSPELQKGSMVILRIEKGSPAYNDRKMQVGIVLKMA